MPLDANSHFLNTYLNDEERNLFFTLPQLPPNERRTKAKTLSKDLFWIGYDLARDGDIRLKEEYINFISDLSAFLKGKHPQKGWASLRNSVDY